MYGTFGRHRHHPGLRHRDQRRAGQDRHRVVDRERRHARPRPPSTATPAPAGPASSATRSGSGRPRQHADDLPGRAAVGGRVRQGLPDPDRPTTAPAWTDDLHAPRTGTGGTADASPSPAPAATCGCTAPPAASGYGYSLWEFKVFTGGGGRPPPRQHQPDAEHPGDPATGRRSGPTTSTARPTPRRRAANWLLRTGTQYPGGAANWGTGSVETASASTANVYLDGAGKLEHQGDPGRRRRLDLGPDRDPAHRLRRRRRRAGQVQRRAQAARRGQRRSATGRASGPPAPPTAATTTTGPASARPTS